MDSFLPTGATNDVRACAGAVSQHRSAIRLCRTSTTPHTPQGESGTTQLASEAAGDARFGEPLHRIGASGVHGAYGKILES